MDGGVQILGPSSEGFPGTPAGSWIGNTAHGAQTAIPVWEAGIPTMLGHLKNFPKYNSLLSHPFTSQLAFPNLQIFVWFLMTPFCSL